MKGKETWKNQEGNKNKMTKDNRKEHGNENIKLMSIINEIINMPCRATEKLPFIFENMREAAKANAKTLQKNNWDVGEVLSQYIRTVMHPGIEFRPVEQLKKLLGQHKDWTKFKDIITKGAAYGFDEKKKYNKETRIANLHTSIKRGNNKSALDPAQEDFIRKNYQKEVTKGWMLPIPKEEVQKIKGAGVIPIGIAKQFTINKNVERVKKKRLMHDCST